MSADAAASAGQSPVVTLTMNPALDISSAVEQVVPEVKLRCGPSRTDPGGGGVNVSRAIRNLGGRSAAVLALGGATGEAYRAFLRATGLETHILPIAGDTRESFTVDERTTGRQFRFVLQGPSWREEEWRRALAMVKEQVRPGGYVVASGSLPPGVPTDFYARVVRCTADAGALAVVDASGAPLATALDEKGVFLIKPSKDELAELVGAAERLDDDALVAAASSLTRHGRCRMVALTFGARGAALVTRGAVDRLPAPEAQVVSTVGAGDAFLAGLVLRLAQGRTPTEAFRTAVAAGTATAMLPATELCRADQVDALEAALAEGGSRTG